MIVSDRTSLHLAVGLRDAGWHPAAWRAPGAQPQALLTAAHWIDQVRLAATGLVDFVTFDDAPRLQAVDARTDQVRGRLDAMMLAARVAPVTQGVGLVPVVATAFTEPFLVSSAIATLDYVSGGRAGWLPSVAATDAEIAATGLAVDPAPGALLADAAEHVEVVRRLWDSWEDDAVIRDVATSRYFDVAKVHHIDFDGERLAVKGPSITPRPPQGQPLVVASAGTEDEWAFATAHADVVVTAVGDDDSVRAAVARAGARHVFADLVVFLDDAPGAAQARKAALDALDDTPLPAGAPVVCATPAQLADRLEAWHALGLTGVRLLPGVVGHDLAAVAHRLVPELQRRGRFRTAYAAPTLRGLLGLARPANRFVAA
jgi:alkanesulfonate monooxygenase SsuD/methylene tetrahydromethanopterin reductase-like flavin-dependent oxidoreductase (luciferase family)